MSIATATRKFFRPISTKSFQSVHYNSNPFKFKDHKLFASKKAKDAHPEPNEEPTTHFGFKTVSESEKPSLVASVFSNVASKYDIMNDLMSAGIHRVWKDEFIKTLHPVPGTSLLDVAGGTGDIAFRYIDSIKSNPLYLPRPGKSPKSRPPSKVLVCDINPDMLEVGKQRAAERGYTANGDPAISWTVGDAEKLPVADESVDAYTIAFGIRNCTHVDQVLKEAFRVLKKGGRFLCLEFSHIETPIAPLTPILQNAYDLYSFNVIPQIGKAVANDEASYQYLVERKFPTQEKFCNMIEEAGFSQVAYKNLTFGVAAIHSGFKL